ncbi:aromatic acid exporter family protein [Bacillus sp. JCM 19034]|uniref:FUSC family protein n=1 Tax=Bacillus sp. JCM 19034 TaxID=1481928 RepID=UPI000782F6DC|nr:aromatic acid exporter family protein [Bacillus sp. JCM 19034]
MKQLIQKQKIVGERMIKTAVAVFVTATVCQFFELPAVFAVIIAIVTIEPTAAASIRKGIIRFPAALIGAALAMTFTYFFGHTALTYTLSAFLTIYVCHKLRLEAGALIATITAVAMIPITNDHYFLSFVERAGTTTIGLCVSTLVNLTILPAHFLKDISRRNQELLKRIAILLEQQIKDIQQRRPHQASRKSAYRELSAELTKNEMLCQYQCDEWKYHSHSIREQRVYLHERNKLEHIQQIHYYIGHLFTIHPLEAQPNDSHSFELDEIVRLLINRLHEPSQPVNEGSVTLLEQFDHRFWNERNEGLADKKNDKHLFSQQDLITFVLLSIDDELDEIAKIEKKKQKLERIR